MKTEVKNVKLESKPGYKGQETYYCSYFLAGPGRAERAELHTKEQLKSFAQDEDDLETWKEELFGCFIRRINGARAWCVAAKEELRKQSDVIAAETWEERNK